MPVAPQQPLVSVVTAYYNGQAYIREAVESALRQTHGAVEVIIVDDGSTEEAHQALLTLRGVTIIRQANGGVAAARNRGLEAARGQYIVYLDQDDRLMPDAIETHLRAAQGTPGAGLIFAAVRLIDETGAVAGSPYLCAPRRNYFLSMIESNFIHCPASAMLSREAMLAVGGLDPETVPSDDFDLYLRLARQYPVVRHTDLVAEYRIHGSNVSNEKSRMLRATHCVLDKIERSGNLSSKERRRIRIARAKARLMYLQEKTPWQKVQMKWFRLRSLLQSSPLLLLRGRAARR